MLASLCGLQMRGADADAPLPEPRHVPWYLIRRVKLKLAPAGEGHSTLPIFQKCVFGVGNISSANWTSYAFAGHAKLSIIYTLSSPGTAVNRAFQVHWGAFPPGAGSTE
jgi:hypothetical protein